MTAPPAVARQVLAALQDIGPDDTPFIRDLIREVGVEPGVHVGTPPSQFDDRMTAEWWLGQVAQTIDDEAWWCMNSLLNWGEERLP